MKSLNPLVVTLLIFTGCAAAVAQPLSGTYTVDNTAVAGPTVFTDLQSAADALKLNGIAGPVEFLVQGTTVDYVGFRIEPFSGSSTTDRVTFRGVGDPVISGALPSALGGIGHTVELTEWDPNPSSTGYPAAGPMSVGTGPNHMVFEDLEITHGFGGGGGCFVAGGSTDITLRRCRIHTADLGIYFHVSNNVVIEDCEIWNISAAIPPGWTPLHAAITLESRSHDSIIRRNRIRDCDGRGILVLDASSLAMWGTNYPNTDLQIVNNFIWNVTGISAYTPSCLFPCRGGGIVVGWAPNAVIANNSLLMAPITATSSLAHEAPGIQLMSSTAAGAVINNVVRHDGTGPCIKMLDGAVPFPATLDHNIYDVGTQAVVADVGGTTTATVVGWQVQTGLEASSFEGPAGYLSATDLHQGYTSLPCTLPGVSHPAVSRDIDGDPRAYAPICRGADQVAPRVGISQSAPGAAVSVVMSNLLPGAIYKAGFSADLCPQVGEGPYLGLCAGNVNDLLAQIGTPIAAGLPFHFMATGTTMTFGPYPLGPATFDAAVFDNSGGAINAVSGVSRLVIQ